MGNKMIRKNLYKKGRVLFLAGALMGAAAFSGCQNTKEPATKNTVTTEEKTTAENKTTEENTTENTTEEKMTEVDYNAVYQEIIDEIQEVVDCGYDYNKDYKYITPGIMEKVTYGMNSSLGYIIEDVNGDDVPELLIGYNESDGGDKIHSYIINAYTANGTNTRLLIDGWVRASYRWLGDGKFYYYGSEGVSVTCMGECGIKDYDNGIVWDDVYFSLQDEDGNETYYHNTTGNLNDENSEKLDITQQDFYKIVSDYENRCKALHWMSIGQPKGYGGEDMSEHHCFDVQFYGQWLFLNGASLYITSDNLWQLRDDEDNWICEGKWESYKKDDYVHISLKKSDGGTEFTEVATGTNYIDINTGDEVLEIEFTTELADYAKSTVALTKKVY